MKRSVLIYLLAVAVPMILYGRMEESNLSISQEKKVPPDTILIDRYEIEGIVITADKRETQIQVVPASVTRLSSLSIENDRILSTTDLTGPIPN